MKELKILSSFDRTQQPSLFFQADGKEKRPLLVGLHTWSYDRFNQVENMLPYAQKLNWNLLLPEFRGANIENNPNCREACGSRAARQDILDAIAYVNERYPIDEKNIFLLGLSGGGHMSLLTAALAPERFKAVASFVPITDLEAWFYEKKDTVYAPAIAACCGGLPEGPHLEEYRDRSPIQYVDELAKANLKLFHGKFDDVVPVAHSIRLYLEIINRYPDSRTFLDIFDGGHEIDMDSAINWFLSQMGNSFLNRITG